MQRVKPGIWLLMSGLPAAGAPLQELTSGRSKLLRQAAASRHWPEPALPILRP